MSKIVIIGGGAAGFFAAITAAESNPENEVIILEKSKKVLHKVKISGGGRCNVTHASFIPNELVEFYPRGKKELLGPFHQFMTGDTMEWFEIRGVPLKIEEDNRIFPESNSIDFRINFAIVDFPEPDSPAKTKTSPFFTENDTSSVALTVTDFVPKIPFFVKYFFKCSTLRISSTSYC